MRCTEQTALAALVCSACRLYLPGWCCVSPAHLRALARLSLGRHGQCRRWRQCRRRRWYWRAHLALATGYPKKRRRRHTSSLMCHCNWLEGVGTRLFLLFYKQERSRALTGVPFPYCSGPVVERFSRCVRGPGHPRPHCVGRPALLGCRCRRAEQRPTVAARS